MAVSKFFKNELSRLSGDDSFDPVEKGEEPSTMTIKRTSLNGSLHSADITYEARDPKGSRKPRNKKRVSLAMAAAFMDEYKSERELQVSSSLEELAIKLGGSNTIGRRKVTQSAIEYSLGDPEEVDTDAGTNLVEMKSGQLRRAATLRPLLEALMQKYVVKDMTRTRAPLKFQTGRFANSAKLFNLVSSRPKKGRYTLSMAYSYMVSPYSVFDPNVSNYRGLASVGRNPQRIIGQAMRNAARDLVSTKYDLNIRQGL